MPTAIAFGRRSSTSAGHAPDEVIRRRPLPARMREVVEAHPCVNHTRHLSRMWPRSAHMQTCCQGSHIVVRLIDANIQGELHCDQKTGDKGQGGRARNLDQMMNGRLACLLAECDNLRYSFERGAGQPASFFMIWRTVGPSTNLKRSLAR
jgi:hypothetical protein